MKITWGISRVICHCDAGNEVCPKCEADKFWERGDMSWHRNGKDTMLLAADGFRWASPNYIACTFKYEGVTTY